MDALTNLGLTEEFRDALAGLDVDLNKLSEMDETPRLEMAAWDALQPASWKAWRRWRSPRMVMAFSKT